MLTLITVITIVPFERGRLKALFDEVDRLFITGLEITQTPQYVFG